MILFEISIVTLFSFISSPALSFVFSVKINRLLETNNVDHYVWNNTYSKHTVECTMWGIKYQLHRFSSDVSALAFYYYLLTIKSGTGTTLWDAWVAAARSAGRGSGSADSGRYGDPWSMSTLMMT